jgi:hypothetical protein
MHEHVIPVMQAGHRQSKSLGMSLLLRYKNLACALIDQQDEA